MPLLAGHVLVTCTTTASWEVHWEVPRGPPGRLATSAVPLAPLGGCLAVRQWKWLAAGGQTWRHWWQHWQFRCRRSGSSWVPQVGGCVRHLLASAAGIVIVACHVPGI